MKGEMIHYPTDWRLCGFILTGRESLTPAINLVGRVKRFATSPLAMQSREPGYVESAPSSSLTNAVGGFI